MNSSPEGIRASGACSDRSGMGQCTPYPHCLLPESQSRLQGKNSAINTASSGQPGLQSETSQKKKKSFREHESFENLPQKVLLEIQDASPGSRSPKSAS